MHYELAAGIAHTANTLWTGAKDPFQVRRGVDGSFEIWVWNSVKGSTHCATYQLPEDPEISAFQTLKTGQGLVHRLLQNHVDARELKLAGDLTSSLPWVVETLLHTVHVLRMADNEPWARFDLQIQPSGVRLLGYTAEDAHLARPLFQVTPTLWFAGTKPIAEAVHLTLATVLQNQSFLEVAKALGLSRQSIWETAAQINNCPWLWALAAVPLTRWASKFGCQTVVKPRGRQVQLGFGNPERPWLALDVTGCPHNPGYLRRTDETWLTAHHFSLLAEVLDVGCQATWAKTVADDPLGLHCSSILAALIFKWLPTSVKIESWATHVKLIHGDAVVYLYCNTRELRVGREPLTPIATTLAGWREADRLIREGLGVSV